MDRRPHSSFLSTHLQQMLPSYDLQLHIICEDLPCVLALRRRPSRHHMPVPLLDAACPRNSCCPHAHAWQGLPHGSSGMLLQRLLVHGVLLLLLLKGLLLLLLVEGLLLLLLLLLE